MREGYSGIGRDGYRRCHARNHLKGHSRLLKKFGLFTAPPEYEWISPLEPGHCITLQCLFHKYPVQIFLGYIVMPPYLSNVDKPRVFSGVSQYFSSHEIIMHHHIRPAQALHPLNRYKVRITGTRAYYIYLSGFFHFSLFTCFYAIWARHYLRHSHNV